MVQSADFGHSDNLAVARRLDLSGKGRVSIQREVRPGMEVIPDVGRHHAPQMVFR